MDLKKEVRVIKPSDSRYLTSQEVATVTEILDYVEILPSRCDTWSPLSHSRNREALRNPFCLRFFRLLCQNFSGYSIYHNNRSDGTNLPYLAELSDREIDIYWRRNDVMIINKIYDLFQKLTRGLPTELIYRPPLWLGESGWIVNDCFLSFDQIFTQEKLFLLYSSGLLTKSNLRILEIGAGYGALASALKIYLPDCSYTIVDLTDSLAFSAVYLTLNQCGEFRFITPYMSDSLNEEFDLVINTLSFAEMPHQEIERYCVLMRDKWLKQDGCLFEQNYDNNETPIRPKPILSNFFRSRLDLTSSRVRGTASIWKELK